MIEPARSFDLAAEEYERTRPDYPTGVLDVLPLDRLAEVLDLGAGTGKLTRVLARRYAHVTAVEPLDGMRARLAAALPGVEVLAATAEQLPLPDGSLAACFSADAFHWFDPDLTPAELHRVLRPRGGVALVWHLPGWETDPPAWWSALVELLKGLRTDHPGFVGEKGRDGFARHGGFEPFAHHTIRSTFATDREGVLAYVQSISYVAGHSDRDRVLAQVADIVRDVGPHESPVRTNLWITRRLA
jgi:SAM-dependent methyltransferase